VTAHCGDHHPSGASRRCMRCKEEIHQIYK